MRVDTVPSVPFKGVAALRALAWKSLRELTFATPAPSFGAHSRPQIESKCTYDPAANISPGGGEVNINPNSTLKIEDCPALLRHNPLSEGSRHLLQPLKLLHGQARLAEDFEEERRATA